MHNFSSMSGRLRFAPVSRPFFLLTALVAVFPLKSLAETTTQPDPSPSADWPKHAIWYQIFPERFRNGDPKNDPTADYSKVPENVKENWAIMPWTKEWYTMEE